jgi:hypothetical protein
MLKYDEMNMNPHVFLIRTPDEHELLALHVSHFNPKEIFP